MGRTAPSRNLQPAAKRKEVRAKNAKSTVNKTIPALLSSTPRAKRGMENAELIVNPSASNTDNYTDPNTTPPLTVHVVISDTLPAAHTLHTHTHANPTTQSRSNSAKNVAVLNMASPLRPGGGVLNGATSPEETLCTSTTLLPSLREEFYRLPELGAIYTPDVLVFRDAAGNDVPKKLRWYVDVVSAGMLRFPELKEGHDDGGEARYASRADERAVQAKMVAVLRILVGRGCEKVVLGAWGCGAYGNPVGAVARAWRKVLLGGDLAVKRKGGGEGGNWSGLTTVVFAIKEVGVARQFAEVFGVEIEPVGVEGSMDAGADDVERAAVEELETKVAEMEEQMSRVLNPDLKLRLESILARLKSELREKKESE